MRQHRRRPRPAKDFSLGVHVPFFGAGNWRLRMPRSWKPADAIGCPAHMHERGRSSCRSFRVARPDRGQARQRDRCTRPSPLMPWHVPNFANDMRGSICPFGLPRLPQRQWPQGCETLRARVSERPALQHAASWATCMQSCAGRTRFHLSVPQCYPVQIQLLRERHYANRSHH